jgi:hypothetical protein
MESESRSKWIASGKLIGLAAIVLFCFSMIIIYIEAHETTTGLSVLIILVSFFLYLLYSSIKTWNTSNKTINFIDEKKDKFSRISELNQKYLEDKTKLNDFLKRRIVNYSESTQKRFGFTITKFEIKEGNLKVFIQYPAGSGWNCNSIEIRAGMYSDLNLIQDLKQFIDGNIE